MPATVRHVPIEGVVVTDAELDHTLGLVLMREAGRLPLYSTGAVAAILDSDSRVLRTMRAFSDVVEAEGFSAAARKIGRSKAGHTVGLMLREEASGRICAFVPGCGDLDAPLLARLGEADAVLFDGTFWDDRELIALDVSSRSARQLDHLPIMGPGGSLGFLAALPCQHRVYTHINNTNQILLEDSQERAIVTQAGLTVGFDGLRITI